MADMLKITSVTNPKNYTMSTRPLAQSDTVFNIADLTKIAKTNDRSAEFRQTDNAFDGNTSLLDIQLKIAKNPSFASDFLKELTSESILSQIAESASPDVIKEFNQFVQNIFLSGEAVSGDLAAQGQGATAFSDELFDILRTMMSQTKSDEVKNAISAFLKNAFTLQTQDQVLKSISANFKYLSQSLAPSKSISEQLGKLSELFSAKDAGMNFQALKETAMRILDSASNSLIATDKIKNMIALVKYNITRFNDNPNALLESFDALVKLADGGELKNSLVSAFEKYVQGSNMTQLSKDALLAGSESFLGADKLTYRLADIVEKQSQIINPNGVKADAEQISREFEALTLNLGTSDLSAEQGGKVLERLLKLVLPQNEGQLATDFMKAFQETKDLNTLITRLSFVLNSIENAEVNLPLADIMNAVLTKLSTSGDINYKPPTSMENLVEFISKAINNENIPLLGIVDPNTLVQSMLTAPGVYTPLLHYLLPVQIDDLRSFGELWVDNDSEGSSSAEDDSHHLFLRFDIEKVGTFELEIFSKNSNLSVSLFCPKDMVKSFSGIKSQIEKVASLAGYSVGKTNVSPLVRIRNLVEIFPNIAERRSGLNVKI